MSGLKPVARAVPLTAGLTLALWLACSPRIGSADSKRPSLPNKFPAIMDTALAIPRARQEAPNSSTDQGPEAAALEAELKKVQTPDLASLARALGLPAPLSAGRVPDSSAAGLENVGDLDGDGIPEAILKWQVTLPAGQNEEETAAPPVYYLLSWDGSGWLASKLVTTDQPVLVKLLPAAAGPKAIAAIVIQGATQIAYPVIFRYQDHRASIEWDGRSDQTYYQGLPFSEVAFQAGGDARFPEMEVTGQADPGLVIFPKSGESRRGFSIRTTYEWKAAGYHPAKTSFTENPDYTLYRFISALHRHDFKSAYALADPRAFVKSGKSNVDTFRQQVEKNWPEFLDDQVFDAVSASGEPLPGHDFELRDEDKVEVIFRPSFGPGPKFLLLGLERVKPK